MADIVVRPSTKLVKPFYFVALLLAALVYLWSKEQPNAVWLYIVPVAVVILAAARQMALQFIKLTIAAGRLRYEVGMLSKSTRTLEIHKVQDVTVTQSIAQRITGTGNISIETAGETSRLTMHNVDRPHDIADKILEAAHQ